ncbi:hypothetical protein SAMN02927921_02898 [Sinomicrobium oceani]|uniref:Uncharacterized protein n=1 Tax=Sinomicrobium oceani TaxID=1150368 RepID=A0A1K1QW67_9FLAO|nr:hypothetical protein [Sinomicrobium oceani]SFW63940.1 hypothetical protein SAMN02927921_02898 [Sinomicrobium oceani]
MKCFPSIRFYVFIFSLIAIYILIDFKVKGYREFPQMDFDWEKKELINRYGVKRIYFVTHNSVGIEYDKDDLSHVENSNTIELITSEGKKYYFRHEYKIVRDSVLFLKGGIWLTKIPENKNIKKAEVNEIKLNYKRNNEGINVCFIGNTDNKWGRYRSLRRSIKMKNREVNFIGSKQDIYGYFYDPVDYKKDYFHTPNVSFYIVFLGKLSEKKDFYKYEKLINKLLLRNGKVIINTWPQINCKLNPMILKKNQFMKQWNENEKIILIDLENLVGGSEIREDNTYDLSKEGYRVYIKEILKSIE